MLEHLRLPGPVTVAAIALTAILFKEFLKKRAGQTAVEGSADNDSATATGAVESDACTSTSPLVDETATSSGYDYEVFLSFSGPDTRSSFTDFLYTSLTDAGIRTFKDDEELHIGEEFSSELLQAINQSKISIPIFSKSYASSVWCLKELVQMVKCQETRGQKIMPIFYDVAPSEVRHQTGCYGQAFSSHKKKRRYREETISEWKAALSAVGAINGWDLHEEKNRREGQFAKTVTQEAFNELKKAFLKVSDNLVNVDHQVDEIMERINAPKSDTRIMVIHGMGGIGKTTIAKIIYNRLSPDFEDHCYLSNIRGISNIKDIMYLQNQLISDIFKMKWTDIKNVDDGTKTIEGKLSNKKVLLLLDDVEEENHVYALVGKHVCLGMGSKLIITTRKRDVLPEADCTYEVHGMDDCQSLQLFSKHAFRRDSPLDEYFAQSYRAIRIAGGLPLALEVIGSLLSRTKKEMWDDKLTMLESVPDVKVRSKLKISYEALDTRQKRIFLDIACLFIGYDKDILVHFWDASRLHSKVAMDDLQNMSLIKIIEDNEVWMHDQLRDLGREIVREESNMEIKKQSRVWDPEEALELRRHEGEKQVEALRLKFDHEMQYRFTRKDFKSLSKLMFLEVGGREVNFCAEESLLWQELPSNVLPTNGLEENSILLPQLLWLSWHNIPTAFEITNFSMENMVILDLSRSDITHDWKGWSHMEVMKSLKILNLSYCQCLERTPNFSTCSNLERLILLDCKSLIEIDRSICQLKRLVSLDVSDCGNLQRLPEVLVGDLARLEYLSLNDCTSMERLPDSIGNLKSLIELHISSTSIREIPDSIRNLKKLKVVMMSYSSIRKISEALWMTETLEIIEYRCPSSPGIHVKIDDCIYKNQSLRILKLCYAEINGLPMLPKSLIELELSLLYMDMETFPDISNLTDLKRLHLRFGPSDYEGISNGLVEVSMPQWIGKLSNLESLDLTSPYVTTSPTDLTLPPRLNYLVLRCPNLRRLPRIPSSLSSFHLRDCKSLCSMEDLSNLKKLSSLEINDVAITQIQGLGCLENLRVLWLVRLRQVMILSDLTNLNKLWRLRVEYCDNLIEIQGELPQSLEHLEIYFCESLQKLPDLSSLDGLRDVTIRDCETLNAEAISRLCLENSSPVEDNSCTLS